MLHIRQQGSYGQPVFFLKTVASVNVNGLRCYASVLHQDGGLLNLLCQGVAIKGVVRKTSGSHNKVLPCCGGNAHLGAKLIGSLGLALGNALDLGCVPAVDLGAFGVPALLGLQTNAVGSS